MHGRWLRFLATLATSAVLATISFPGGVEAQDYFRPVDAAPQAEDIGESYTVPQVQRPRARPEWQNVADVVLLGLALVTISWLVLRTRRRGPVLALTILCLLYFGFYREGCVCPIGATQNVAVALTDASYTVPLLVVIIFFLPLVAAVFFGRVFCGGVCPLGAIQDVVLVWPVQVPRRLDRALGLLKYIYLALAIGFAVLPALYRDFIICRFDPFVSLFRRTGTASMLIAGGVLLVAGLFVGRIYCRYLCPYGALLALVSRIAWRPVSISPGREIDCGLCSRACPFGAIEKNRAIPSACLSCARCYGSCPIELERRGEPVELPPAVATAATSRTAVPPATAAMSPGGTS